MQQLADTIEKEIPDTATTMRLTGLEMSDAIQEVSLLRCVSEEGSIGISIAAEYNALKSVSCSLDVASGLQASARMVQTAEEGVKQGVAYLQSATAETLLPAVRRRLPGARSEATYILSLFPCYCIVSEIECFMPIHASPRAQS